MNLVTQAMELQERNNHGHTELIKRSILETVAHKESYPSIVRSCAELSEEIEIK